MTDSSGRMIRSRHSGLGLQMPAHLGTFRLRVAEVTPTVGTNTLYGVSLVSISVGQVMVPDSLAAVAPCDTLTFTDDGNLSAGPIGFSAALPEPGSPFFRCKGDGSHRASGSDRREQALETPTPTPRKLRETN